MNSTAIAQHTVSATSALLKISGLRLVLPQNEILALEAVAEVDARDAGPLSVGWLQHARQRWPVYCLAPDLSLLGAVPVERRACVLLGTEDGCLGILCDDVSIEQALKQRHALPPALHAAGTPVLGLIELEEGGIACVTDTQRLAAHVALRGAA
jgi:hypothetical protein